MRKQKIKFTIVFSSEFGDHLIYKSFIVEELLKNTKKCTSNEDYRDNYIKSRELLNLIYEIPELSVYMKLVLDDSIIINVLSSISSLVEEIKTKDSEIMTGVIFFNLYERSVDYHRVVCGDHTLFLDHNIKSWIHEKIWYDGIDTLNVLMDSIDSVNEIVKDRQEKIKIIKEKLKY